MSGWPGRTAWVSRDAVVIFPGLPSLPSALCLQPCCPQPCFSVRGALLELSASKRCGRGWSSSVFGNRRDGSGALPHGPYVRRLRSLCRGRCRCRGGVRSWSWTCDICRVCGPVASSASASVGIRGTSRSMDGDAGADPAAVSGRRSQSPPQLLIRSNSFDPSGYPGSPGDSEAKRPDQFQTGHHQPNTLIRSRFSMRRVVFQQLRALTVQPGLSAFVRPSTTEAGHPASSEPDRRGSRPHGAVPRFRTRI